MPEPILDPLREFIVLIGGDATELSSASVQALYKAYSNAKSRIGGAAIAEKLGVEKGMLAAFEPDFRHLARRSARASEEESRQATRDLELAAWVVQGWLEAFQQQGAALGLQIEKGETNLELRALRQVRAAEQILRDLVREAAGGADALTEELTELLGSKAVNEWAKRARGGDALDGTTFSEIGSLVAAKGRFTKFQEYFERGEALRFLPDRRKSLVRFLDEIRRVRNTLMHNRSTTQVMLRTLDRCYDEIATAIQESFDAGVTGVNPLGYLDASDDEVREWAAGMQESLEAVHDSIDDFRVDVTTRLEGLSDGVERAATAAETGTRRSRWILAAVILLMGGVYAVWRGVSSSGDTLDGVVAQNEEIAAGVEEIAETMDEVASLGGLIAKPRTRDEFIHNARLLGSAGRRSASTDAYQRALELGPRTLDIAREYVDSLVAVEGEEIARARVLRWLDPAGGVYRASGGSIALSGSALPDASQNLAVEAALLALIESDRAAIEWARELAPMEGGDSIRVAVLERFAQVSSSSRTRAIMELCRDVWAELQGAGPRALEDCFFDRAMATRTRDQVAGLTQIVEAMSDEYWGNDALVKQRGSFDNFQVTALVPDVGGQAVLEVDGEFYDLVASPSVWREGRSLQGDGAFSRAELESPYWTHVRSPSFSYGDGEIEMALIWTPLDGAGPQRVEFTVDSLAVCSQFWRQKIEGWPSIEAFGHDVAEHGPGAFALRPDFAGMTILEAARAVDTAKWVERWSERGATETLPCSDAYLLCEVADPEAKGYSCGGHPVTVTAPPRLQPGRAQLDFSQLIRNRRGIASIQYSLGTPALDQELSFEKLDHRTRFDSREQYGEILSVSGGEYVTGSVMVIDDRFRGPLFLRWSYLDGTKSKVVKVDLVDPLAPPRGWPEKDLAELKSEADKAVAEAATFESTPVVGAVTYDQIEFLDGGTARWQSKVPGAFRSEFSGPVRHGQMVWSSEDGDRDILSVWADDLPLAISEKDADGRVVRFQLAVPLWEKPESWYGPFDGWSQRPPSSLRPVGPFVGMAAGGGTEEGAGVWFEVTRDWLSTAKPAGRRPLEGTVLTGGLSFGGYLGPGHLLNPGEPFSFETVQADLDGSGHPGIYASWDDQVQELGLMPPAFSSGRGLVIDGLPVGYWSELDDTGSIRAQGWVVPWGEDHPWLDLGGNPLSKFVARRVGRWFLFDEEEQPIGFMDYSGMGEMAGYLAVFNADGQPEVVAYNDDGLPFWAWKAGEVVAARGGVRQNVKSAAELGFPEVKQELPLAGPVRWPE